MATAEALPLRTATHANPSRAAGAGLIRFTTAGSVDDGKSTLIGRLLYDSNAVFDDQLAAVRKSRINRSGRALDLSLLTDGLRAEREQGITIDVAYRYFATPRRKFIIADTPGHEQYTRNMVTGASSADVAVILLDASKGLLTQSKRHAFIASLLRVQHVIAAVNKMDLVAYRQDVFQTITADFEAFAQRLGLKSVFAIPVSALDGDQVVRPSRHMPWYSGPTLLECLEMLPVERPVGPLRFPVQYVIRPDAGFRGFAGQVASGVVRKGDPVVALPSGMKTRIARIATFDGDLERAVAGQSVTLTLADEIDLGRGDLLVHSSGAPSISRRIEASLVWMHERPMRPSAHYLLKHTTRMLRARIAGVHHLIDVNHLQPVSAATLRMNDIAEVVIETTQPLAFDAYESNRATGSFILIDPATNATVAAGMIRGAARERASFESLSATSVSAEERAVKLGHGAALISVTERPSLGEPLERQLFNRGYAVQLLSDVNLSPAELAVSARALLRAGLIVIVASAVPNEVASQMKIPFLALDSRSADDAAAVDEVVQALEQVRT
jgi:sulfate adenylyltransferase large subunit